MKFKQFLSFFFWQTRCGTTDVYCLKYVICVLIMF